MLAFRKLALIEDLRLAIKGVNQYECWLAYAMKRRAVDTPVNQLFTALNFCYIQGVGIPLKFYSFEDTIILTNRVSVCSIAQASRMT